MLEDYTSLVRSIFAADTAPDIDEVTKDALAACLDSDDPSRMLYRVCRSYTSSLRRERTVTREVAWEQAERNPVTPPAPEDLPVYKGKPVPWVNPATEARNKLSREKFAVPGEGMVEWGQATVEQHRAAIVAAYGEIKGHKDHIARHELAVTKILGADVTCLDEIPV